MTNPLSTDLKGYLKLKGESTTPEYLWQMARETLLSPSSGWTTAGKTVISLVFRGHLLNITQTVKQCRRLSAAQITHLVIYSMNTKENSFPYI